MRETIKRGAFQTVGWGLVIIGVIGLFLPFLQGVLLIALGLFLVSRYNERVKNEIEKYRKKFPAFDRALDFLAGKKRETNS